MDTQQLVSINAKLTDNNRELLKPLLVEVTDEMAFSDNNKVRIKHGGVVGNYVEYEKALTLLKKLGIVNEFRNIRAGKPADFGIHVTDEYEIEFEEKTLLAFNNLISGNLDGSNVAMPTRQQVVSLNQPTEKIRLHPLKPQHYSDRKGILLLNPDVELAIAIKGRTMHKNGKPYAQCKLMGELFRNVKTIKSGIFFSKFYGVNDRFIDKKMEKKIRNAVSEINKKVASVGGPKNLIYIQDKKVHVNHSYL